VDASAALNLENVEGVSIFAFVNPKDKAKVRKALKDTLQYVEAFAKNGYIGTVAGINLYDKADATEGEIVVATKEAVTIFKKKGVEIERERDANIRKNTAYSRKYYVVALTNESKAVKIKLNA
jgi:hydrogenase maturation factor